MDSGTLPDAAQLATVLDQIADHSPDSDIRGHIRQVAQALRGDGLIFLNGPPQAATREDYLAGLGLHDSVRRYLLAGDGFIVPSARPDSVKGYQPSTRVLAEIWTRLFDQLVRDGRMRRSQTGHYWWNQ